ncbi:LmeA family phospholipid-binding protein [Spirillospora sp. CA-294931]|uniref:LmeA family phospholipid-binding protein n=1 Tax=Spirillospora sp. CA-294931 TaxID=3240042 RepID=UPI003D8B167E
MRKALLVLLVLFVGAVIAADRIGVRIAQNEIGKQVATQYAMSETPKVKIHGFPFLTQALGGNYDKIDVTISQWTDQGITVQDVKVEMKSVKAPLSEVSSGNADNVTAGTATASAVIPYELIKQRAPREVKRIGPKGDDLEVDLTGTISGLPMAGTATVSVKPSAKGIVITPISIGSSGGPQIPLALVKQRLGWIVPVRDLPVGSRISKIEPTAEGLRVSATADDVRLNDLQNAKTR